MLKTIPLCVLNRHQPVRRKVLWDGSNYVGHCSFCSAALDAGGSLAGYSDLRVALARTTQASVGVTMVLPEHRGHRLGLAIKLATHRALLRAFPECEVIRTGNADVNEHMNAVNELMGYRLVEDIVELQKRL